MGGVGLSYANPLYLNNMNPALLPANSLSTFSVGLEGNYNRISDAANSTSNIGGGLNYIVLGLPIVPGKWTLSAGLMPYSQVNFNYSTTQEVPDTDVDVTYSYEGEGGISQASLSNGVRLTKNFSLGIKASYLFGSIINESSTQLNDSTVSGAYRPVLYERTSFSDFSFSGGLAYTARLKERTSLNIGITYELQTEVGAKNLSRLERRTFTGQPISSDTLIPNVSGFVILPARYGFGVSVVKTFNWTVGADFNYQAWSEFRNFNDNNGGLDDNYMVALGGEYTPDIASIDSYLKRITYRMGLNYEKTPFKVNNEQLSDFGINFGMSLPVSRLSSLDLAFKVGQRGSTDNGLIKEQYFRVFLGVTFNDRWFVRRQFD